MTTIISEQLRTERSNKLVALALQNSGKVTPDQLVALAGSQKMLLNYLWIARRSGYINVEQIREGRKISYWLISTSGSPVAPVSAPAPSKSVKPAKLAKAAAKVVKEKKPKVVKTAVSETSVTTARDLSSVGSETVTEIKEKNLSKIRQVAGAGRFCDGKSGLPEGWTSEIGRQELAAFEAELDSFKMPAFLTREEIKYIV